VLDTTPKCLSPQIGIADRVERVRVAQTGALAIEGRTTVGAVVDIEKPISNGHLLAVFFQIPV
jgi:hypothetical protein